VPKDFAQESLDFYRLRKSEKHVTLTNSIVISIREDLKNTYIGPLSQLKESGKLQQIASILSIFAAKRSDIGYHYGMNFIAAVMVNVFPGESDAFVMFSHTIENVFPSVMVT
jgi:hypothetical protein